MAVTYTNRKGVTYYLTVTVTRNGRPGHVFTRTPSGGLTEKIPDGFEVSESVNGVVSLVRSRVAEILEAEIDAVCSALKKHPKSSRFRADVRRNAVQVYERVGGDEEEIEKLFQGIGVTRDAVRKFIEERSQYTPVLRFLLVHEDRRLFQAERMCYRGDNHWLPIEKPAPIDRLARKLVPMLGTEAIFELY